MTTETETAVQSPATSAKASEPAGNSAPKASVGEESAEESKQRERQAIVDKVQGMTEADVRKDLR